MNNKNIILHLSLVKNLGPVKNKQITDTLEQQGIDLSALYTFTHNDFKRQCGLSEQTAQLVHAGLQNRDLLNQELTLLEKHEINLITIQDSAYPEQLKAIHAAPTVLYWQGNKNLLIPFDSLAVVGSRAMTSYGTQVIEQLIAPCVQHHLPIISGGAIGIDTHAHKIAIAHGGKTVVILGSGLLQPYPASNKKLFKEIIEKNGYLISSFPLTMEALPGNFPARNRIIAGLAHTTLVVQASIKSGSLITAHYALEQGRNVAAVPGPIYDQLSMGCNNLIKQGAYAITLPADLLELFNIKEDVKNKEAKKSGIKNNHLKENVSINQKKIIDALSQKSLSVEEIVDETSLSLQTIQSELFTLECLGIIQNEFLNWKIK